MSERKILIVLVQGIEAISGFRHGAARRRACGRSVEAAGVSACIATARTTAISSTASSVSGSAVALIATGLRIITATLAVSDRKSVVLGKSVDLGGGPII